MNRLAIVGVGLIGTSFALALRKAGFDGEIVGVSSERSIEAGIRAQAISRGVSLEEAADWADLIYLSQPIDQILQTLAQLGSIARQDCLVTDAGSTKSAIVEAAARHVKTATFLGGHPMAGKESRGAESADADLFAGRPYVLTPDAAGAREGPAESIRVFRRWLERIGARVYEMSAREHDQTVALTSHLPQLLSTALAVTLSSEDERAVTQVFGPGLVDMTRLALSAPRVWMSVLATNREAVLRAINIYEATLADIRRSLAEGELEALFEKGSEFARNIRDSSVIQSTGTK
jgi:prephenate dehydrogenase